MLNAFCMLTGANDEEFDQQWMKCQEQILKYAPLEKKKSVKTIMKNFSAIEDSDTGM